MYITLGEYFKNALPQERGVTPLEQAIILVKNSLIRRGINPNSLNFIPKEKEGRIEVTPNDAI